MKSNTFRAAFALIPALLFLAADRASAQAPLEPAQLPERTSFYVIWRGAPSPEARKANALLALWDDPDFAPARSALAENLLSSSDKDATKQGLTSQELEDFSALLENSFVLGYLSQTEKHDGSNSANSSAATERPWNSMFFVYDRTGKEALLTKAILRLRTQEKDPAQISQVAIGGVQALKMERKSGVSYWVENGKYAASASERSVLEEILRRLDGKSATTASLAQSAAYREAQPLLGGGVLEFFVRLSRLKELAADTNPGGIRLQPLLEAIKIDSVHSLCGHVSLEGSKTRVQAALLGDATPGTIFDIWPEGQPAPASLALVPPGAVSLNATQLNLLGIYQIAKRAISSAFPQGQQGNADLVETLAQTRLGMPLPDALGSLSGEFASLQTSPTMDPTKQVFLLGIRKKTEALKLIRTLYSEQIESETSVGETTFLKISLQSKSSAAGSVGWKFYHLAVTPDFLLGASRKETLRELLAQHSQAPSATNLDTSTLCKLNRAQFPEKLNGLSCFDFQKLDWQALKDRWLAEAKTSSEARNAGGTQKTPAKAQDWLTHVNPQVFSRHLHSSSSVSWKDAKGIHYDQWLE